MQYLVTISQTITVETDDEDDAIAAAAEMFNITNMPKRLNDEDDDFGDDLLPIQTNHHRVYVGRFVCTDDDPRYFELHREGTLEELN